MVFSTMFKVPDWETDVPETLHLLKRPKNNGSINKSIKAKSIQNVVENTQDDQNLMYNSYDHSFPIVTNGNASRKKKKRKHHSITSIESKKDVEEKVGNVSLSEKKPKKANNATKSKNKNDGKFTKESEGCILKELQNNGSINKSIKAKSIQNVVENTQDDQNLMYNSYDHSFPIVTNSNASRKKKKRKHHSITSIESKKDVEEKVGNVSLSEKKPKKANNATKSKNKNDGNFTKESEGCILKELQKTEEAKPLHLNSPKDTKQELISGLSNGKIPSKKIHKAPKKRKHSDDTNKEMSNVIVDNKKIKLNDNESATENKIINSSQKEKLIRNNKKENKSMEKERKNEETIHINMTQVLDKNLKINNTKKEKIKKLLEQSHRTPINTTGNKLRERMMEKLKAAQFRYLNEKLYTSSGEEAQKIFQSDPAAFRTYHQGYQHQVKKWPVNPLDVIVKKILKMPKSFVIADMGCGEAALSKRVPQQVHSFDLVSSAPGVVACDMARTPLLKSSTDVVVYCLALMGTELTQYLVEANRILKTGGQLLIAEVESRFDDVTAFAKDVERLGFRLKSLDEQHSVFFFMQFVKAQDSPVKRAKLPVLNLKPCLYKRR